MRISELSAVTGLSVPTVKFYIREGMLPRGHVTSATSAEYSDAHVRRIRLIMALADTAQLPLARVKQILDILDAAGKDGDPATATASAVAALPPYTPHAQDYPYAREALEHLGYTYDPEYAATRQLDAAIRALIASGLDWEPSYIERYAEPVMQIAKAEIQDAAMQDPERRLEVSVLGTVMPESIILSLRRLSHRAAIKGE